MNQTKLPWESMDGICLVKKIDTLVPKNDTLVPKIDTLVPKIDTLVPKIDTLVPKIDTLVPKIDTLVPNIDTLVPKIDTLVPKNDTLVPKNDTYKFQEISINLQLTPNVSNQLSSTLGLVKNSWTALKSFPTSGILLCKRNEDVLWAPGTPLNP